MPEFANPFSGRVPDRKLYIGELARAIRLDIAAEEEAIHLYEAQADATDNPLAAAVLRDVAREERVHVGEFQHLLNMLLEDEAATLAEGAEEVDQLAASSGVSVSAGNGTVAQPPAAHSVVTIGSLRHAT